MAKRIVSKPDWVTADVTDIYSVSGCMSENFLDYIKFWKHNGYWFFNTPNVIVELARENGVDTLEMRWFYYEVYEKQFDEEAKVWADFQPEASFSTDVALSQDKKLEGFDVVDFWVQTSPECSPLSCNNLAQDIPVNAHCLLGTFEEAKAHLEAGRFDNSEPGPFRIFAVYSIPAPDATNRFDISR
jgi:hypothetical protein